MKNSTTLCRIIMHVFLLSSLLISSTQATIAVKVFSLDEGMSENNISKPRIYIQNTGTETINDFTYRYYFTTENGKAPMLEDYYTPSEQIMLVPSGGGYYVQYTITGANLTPGGLIPQSSGNSVGLHYNDWSVWDKTNDFSNNQSSSFAENQNISVYVAGTKIYGNEPGGVSGSVLREVWTGFTGTTTDNIPVNTTPQISGPLSTLDEPRQFADNFGSRIRGYITAPATGSYTFWIASDDDSKLYLSTDANPANKGSAIASVTGWTDYLQWNKFSLQQSGVKTLVQGTKYYIEILHRDGNGNDNCSVGWLKPNQSGSVPSEIVPSAVLTPYVPPVIPAIPTNLTATAVSSQRIDISWTDASNNEYGFRLEKAIGTGAFSEFAVVSANQTSYQVTGLSAETLYKFRIRAYNDFGNSDYSNTAQATSFAVPVGSVTRELWTGRSGSQISDIPLSQPANSISPIYQLETGQQAGDYYGQRIRGYIIPATSGSYTFWIASDDASQLWLSTNDQAASKQLIASVSVWTGYREWNKYTSQKSSVITLTAGVRYYVEILHKEGNGSDNLSVGWLKPGQSGTVPSEVIPGAVLSPFIIPSIPAAPGGLNATALSATQIDLTWTDNSNNENGFRIERSVGGGPFVEVGTAAANALIYHDAGLAATTQYQYRIRSYNDLGNSGYSNSATAVTPAQTPVEPPIEELSSFAVYSTDKTTLKDHCYFNGGGAVGSNTLVEMFPQSVVNGNVISGSDVTLNSQAIVNGNVYAAGTVTLASGAVVNDGFIEQGATVATISLPSMATIPTGTAPQTVNPGQNLPLAPGYYGALIVCTGGTLTLSAGAYTFTSFYLQTDAHVVLNAAFNDMVDIAVSGDVEFSDRSTMLFADKGYVPFIRFYTNDNNMVRIGCNVKFTGILSAPHGDIHVYSRSQCNGALYAKTIYIEPDAVINSGDVANQCEDSDHDHVANIIEVITGTDPNNASEHIPMAVPSNACIDNTQNVSITYDFSFFYKDYAFAKVMNATFSANSLIRPYIPLIITVDNTPVSGIPVFSQAGYDVLDRYINFRSENGLTTGSSFILQVPQRPAVATTSFKPYQYNSGTSQWEAVPAARIIRTDATSQTLRLENTNPIVFAGPKKTGSKTIYFDGGYVYSDNSRALIRYSINLTNPTAVASDITSVSVRINYTDKSSGTPVVKYSDIPLDFIPNADPIKEAYAKYGSIVNNGAMHLDGITVTINHSGGTTDTYTQSCSTTSNILSSQTMMVDIDQYLFLLVYLRTKDMPWFSVYFSPSDVVFESAGFGDGRIIYNTSGVGETYTYEYYGKDHLGSTRTVISKDEEVTEAIMYHPYGTMKPVGSISTPAIAVREQFTTKEFDKQGGTGSGTDGMRLNYFGARYYDPEIGVWTSVDPKEQEWHSYSYCGGNPVNAIDPNGESFWNWILGPAGAYIGGVAANDWNWNPVDWNWHDLNTYSGMIGGFATGYGIGNMIDNGIALSNYHQAQTAYFNEVTHENCALNKRIICFAAGTLIRTKNGFIDIQNIQVGDSVLSCDSVSGKEEYKRVVKIHVTPERPVLKVSLSENIGIVDYFLVTPGHPFYVHNFGWVSAGTLLPGYEVDCANGRVLTVASIEMISERTTVYNFEVEENHSYYVGKEMVLVHNGDPCDAITRAGPRLKVNSKYATNSESLPHFIARNVNEWTMNQYLLSDNPLWEIPWAVSDFWQFISPTTMNDWMFGMGSMGVHGNSLSSLRSTWGYKLFDNEGTFLKNGITSRVVPESRYLRSFMSDKYMDVIQFPNRLSAYQWETQENIILRGPLNLNGH